MSYALITLIVVGIVLFVLSFFTNDKIKDLEDQIDDLSVTTLKESYQLKRKIKILEEELLTDFITENVELPTLPPEEKLPPVYKQIKKMHEVGFTIDQIANNTTLKPYDVRAILHQVNPDYVDATEGDA
ncbi:hypothetical protein [Salirhabdus sp. Marseille-P4669]|uniref:hypothetical protein n=1 Tax=Salirhabdus sp. Marseille-P4669 TaxID=2042310 RepID=UPI000C7A04BD|nr:hypothetical protein [Salirhabdus sp. Marseille-P4669]